MGSPDLRPGSTIGGPRRLLQMVNGPQHRVEVLAVTAVAPHRRSLASPDEDDAPATPPRHPPVRGGAVPPRWNGGGIEKAIDLAAAGNLARYGHAVMPPVGRTACWV